MLKAQGSLQISHVESVEMTHFAKLAFLRYTRREILLENIFSKRNIVLSKHRQAIGYLEITNGVER